MGLGAGRNLKFDTPQGSESPVNPHSQILFPIRSDTGLDRFGQNSARLCFHGTSLQGRAYLKIAFDLIV
jgi:hypothetical protein